MAKFSSMHTWIPSRKGNLSRVNRGFRYNWIGISLEEPAIDVLRGQGDGKPVNIHVSCNGDTQAAAWQFYAEGDLGFNEKFVLGEVIVGSEAHLEVKNLAEDEGVRYCAEAVNAERNILASLKTLPSTDRSFAGSNYLDHINCFFACEQPDLPS